MPPRATAAAPTGPDFIAMIFPVVLKADFIAAKTFSYKPLYI